MRLIKFLSQNATWKMALISVLSIFSGLFGAAIVAVIGKAITVELTAQQAALWFFTFCALYVVTKSVSEVWLLRHTQKLVYNYRVGLSEKVANTDQSRLDKIGKDGLMMILTKDLDNFSMAFHLLPATASNIIVIFACLGYSAWLSWEIFLIFMVTMFFCVGGYILAEKKPLQLLFKSREVLGGLYENLRGVVDGNRELKLNHGRKKHFINEVVAKDAAEFTTLYSDSMTRYTWTSNCGNILFYQGIAAVLFLLPLVAIETTAILTSATLVMLYVVRPISELMMSMPSLRQANVSLERIMEIDSDLNNESLQLINPDPFGADLKSLELDELTFSYDSSEESFTVGPVSLELRPAEIVFIVGGNGSGKTSLAMLLLGLYTPSSGCMRLNSKDVDQDNIINYRQRFSAVFANSHLFKHLPVNPNIDVTKTALSYLDSLQLSGKVRVENNQYSTIDLSTGQRKRLMLISSYLEDREFYVFDEWAADQDPDFKRVFYTKILPELKARNKSVVVISHDDRFFDQADRLIWLEEGKVKSQEQVKELTL